MHIVVICRDCGENGRPRTWRHACDDCASEQMARHTADFPNHIIETSWWNPDAPQLLSRSTQRPVMRYRSRISESSRP